jgi:glutamate synthase (NADPH/NADH) large chain
MRLVGDANDYLGKGLSGGRLIVHPPEQSPFTPEENIIAGNVILYGATSGEVFLRGLVGERFCVRNSGATAVVEGVGDHGCEYMTGGRAVVLGATGRNFAAGMSGGIAYVYDPGDVFPGRVNMVDVDLDPLDDDDQEWLREIIRRHEMETSSAVAARLLEFWHEEVRNFVKVMPKDYKRVLEAARAAEERGDDIDAAVMAAAHG